MSDTVDTRIIELARSIAVAHGLEPALICAVIEQESAWNPWAVRYEPGFLSRYVAPLYTAGKLSATEAYTRSMSWGLMQVMGLTAREAGFKGEFLSELDTPEVGLKYGCIKLTSCLTHRHGDVADALEMYNGGGDLSYAPTVLAIQARYALAVTLQTPPPPQT